MLYFLFIILWLSPSSVYCNYTDNNNYTVFVENITEVAVLSKTVNLKCPQLVTNANIETIIWRIDQLLFIVPLNRKDTKHSDIHYRGGENGSLIIDNVNYNDTKIYKCEAYGGRQLYEVHINLIVKGPPNRVHSFVYESLTDTTLKFSWDISVSTSNVVDTFNLTLCKSLITKDCNTVSISYPMNTHTFQRLTPFTEYRSSIVAINNIGVSERLDLKAKTLPGTPTARPYILKNTVGSRNVSLTIECVECLDKEKMQGTLKSFFISCTDGTNILNSSVPYNNSSRVEAVTSKLLPYRNYKCSVSAYNGVKYSPIDVVPFKTSQDFPNPTTFLFAPEISSNKIIIKWKAAEDKYGPVTGYLLKVFLSHTDQLVYTNKFDRNINESEISKLDSRTTYLIRLWTINGVGQSAAYTTLEVTTDRKLPNIPQILDLIKSGDVVRLTWNFTESSSSKFSYYICFKYPSNQIDSCFTTQPDEKGSLACHCSLNETRHWIEIPLNKFASNETSVTLWMRISVQSDLCSGFNECTKLESPFSLKRTLSLRDHVPPHKIVIDSSGHLSLIIGLVIGIIVIIVLCILFALAFCKNDPKYLCFSSRQNMYYSRPSGEYIEVFTTQPQSISKILPLEKSPYPHIPVSSLIEYINNQRADDGAGFQAEFEAIECMDSCKWNITHAVLKENKSKNRYTNIFPYDHSRVVLQNSSYGKFDYINASFVDGFQRSNAYIATQGPLLETIADFWQMVWEQNSEIIVMISNFVERGRSKCEMYWSPTKVLSYGNISVRQIYQKEMAFYTERRFKIRNIRTKKNMKERIVYHYQYTDWRDFDVPPSSLPVLVFVRATTKHWSESSGPIVVHCSAGVGRTGTYICIESEIRQLDAEHQVNVRGFLEHIRQQRMKLVQTESQYTFIHDALYEYFLYPDREIHKSELSAYITRLRETDATGYMKLETQFKKCINFEPTDYDYMESKKRYNLIKNRSDVMPIESRRINLSSEPGVEGSNYINASAIQGYWQMKEFIITQHPLNETEQDFWKMVWDENCTLIILLSNENMHQFWPRQETNARTFRGFRVAHCNSEDKEFSVQYSFLMSSSREDYALDCTMHVLKRWPGTISECGEMLRLLFEINSNKYNGPIVVIDEYGSSKAGVFVAMSSLLHQLANDDVVNVYYVMKMIHIERPHTFSSSADLMFIYELLEFVILNQQSYNFFSRPHQDFIPNGIGHLPVTQNSILNNNNIPITHYSTLGTVRSKSSTSTSRRRASSVDSEPYGVQTPSPYRKEHFGNRISWNVGETRHNGTPLLSESYIEWPNSVCNGHYNGPSTNNSFENPHISDLPVAKVVTHPSAANQNVQSSIYNLTNNGALDTSTTSSSTVWCGQKL